MEPCPERGEGHTERYIDVGRCVFLVPAPKHRRSVTMQNPIWKAVPTSIAASYIETINRYARPPHHEHMMRRLTVNRNTKDS